MVKAKTKTKMMFGYKYTPEEYEYMKGVLHKYKEKNNLKTTQAILEVFRKIDENNLY